MFPRFNKVISVAGVSLLVSFVALGFSIVTYYDSQGNAEGRLSPNLEALQRADHLYVSKCTNVNEQNINSCALLVKVSLDLIEVAEGALNMERGNLSDDKYVEALRVISLAKIENNIRDLQVRGFEN